MCLPLTPPPLSLKYLKGKYHFDTFLLYFEINFYLHIHMNIAVLVYKSSCLFGHEGSCKILLKDFECNTEVLTIHTEIIMFMQS